MRGGGSGVSPFAHEDSISTAVLLPENKSIRDLTCTINLVNFLDMKILVSPEDEDLLKNFEWTTNGGYVTRRRYKSFPDEPRALHRLIMERVTGRKKKDGEFCDHINGDRFDNRRENLRLTDAAGNAQNKSFRTTRGTSWDSKMNKWLARVNLRRKRINVGWFDSREDAIEAARQKRQELGFLEGNPKTWTHVPTGGRPLGSLNKEKDVGLST